MGMSDPGDAVRQAKGAEKMRRVARWNGAMLIAASVLMLIIALGRASDSYGIYIAIALFAIFIFFGFAIRRWTP